jgi:DNA anti-recombination protein RmuC
MQIEEQTKEIRTRVEDLGRHLGAYDGYLKSLGKNLGTTVNQYNLASKEFAKLDKDVLRITGEGNGIEVLQIDKPLAE